MKLLLHICCAPCAIMPLTQLRASLADPLGYFYNPNIQPFKEYERRLAALLPWAHSQELDLRVEGYNPLGWLRRMAYNEKQRCQLCYQLRLQQAGLMARRLRRQAFTSTLLYSVYQNREDIVRAGRAAQELCQVEFLEYDFRPLWHEGQQQARALKLYRQPYCGCIYSEAERYMKTDLTLAWAEGENNAVQSS